MAEHVIREVSGGVMTLTLARADKKNALSNAMYSALSDGLEDAEKDPAVRVVLFQGDGDSFTTGNDLADFSAQANGQDTGESQAFRFISNLGKATRPLVAAHRVECIRTIQRENLDVFPGLHGDGRVFFHAVSHHFVVDVCPEVALSSTSFQPYPSNRAMRKD
jgi:Enoyl-CoA hydratase/isomerase